MSPAFARRVSANVYDENGELLADSQITWFVNRKNAGAGEHTRGHSSLEVEDARAEVSVQARYGGKRQGPVTLANDQQSYDFRFSVSIHPPWRDFAMKHFPALTGVLFILLGLGLAFYFGCPNTLQQRLILATFALGAGGFGGEIAGFLKVDLSLTQKATISAGGAMAVFIILFFFVPAGSLPLANCPTPATSTAEPVIR